MKNLGILKPPPLAVVKGSIIGGDKFLTQDKDMSIGAVYTAEIKKRLVVKFLV
jgi:hypothetical protein